MAPQSGTPGLWGLEWWYASRFAVVGALALGTFSGGLLGGVLAESVGFNWLPVAGGIAVAVAVVLSIPGFRGVDTRTPVGDGCPSLAAK